MIATRANRIGAFLTLALVAWLVPGRPGLAQATKPRPAPPAVKAKPTEPAKAREPVDLNSATAEELASLPGIGDAYARRIIENRPHKAVADLAQVGIPSTTVDKLGPMVAVRPLPPAVDVNADSIEKLQTLPGVGPVLAREIVAGRPYSKYDDLGKVKGIGPAKLDDLRGRLKFGKGEPKAKKAEAAPAAELARVAAASAREKAPRPTPAPGAKVNLNTASLAELDALPGIGPARAQSIIAARPFSTVEDVMKVKGIKEVEFGKIKDMITVK